MTPSPSSTNEIISRLIARRYSAEEVQGKVKVIHDTILRQSPRIRTGNFTAASAADLAMLFELYDGEFFGTDLRKLVSASGAPVRFDFSSRLTRSAGLTKRFAHRARKGEPSPPPTRFEIVLSSTLLFQTFQEVERTVRVNGLVCQDRLEAAQRVFEHELMHLAEMLVWGKSNCEADRYRNLVWNFFTHPETRHDLVTQQEVARTQFDIRVGDRVSFEYEGVRHVGVVNRITRRATVLVESPRGIPYSNGKKYAKYYIPLTMLRKESLMPPGELRIEEIEDPAGE